MDTLRRGIERLHGVRILVEKPGGGAAFTLHVIPVPDVIRLWSEDTSPFIAVETLQAKRTYRRPVWQRWWIFREPLAIGPWSRGKLRDVAHGFRCVDRLVGLGSHRLRS